jgi:hypothetical protein
VDIAIAVPPAAKRPTGNNGGAPTGATKEAPKAGSITATVSASTGAAKPA